MDLISQKSAPNVPRTESDVSEELKTSYNQQEQQWEKQSVEYYQQTNQQTWQSEQQVTEYSQQSTSHGEAVQQQTYGPASYPEQAHYWNQQPQYWEDSKESKVNEEQKQPEFWNAAQNEQPTDPPNEPKSDVSIIKSFNIKYQRDVSTSAGLRKRTNANNNSVTATQKENVRTSVGTNDYGQMYRNVVDESATCKHVSDSESESKYTSKQIEFKNEENSQIICYRDKDKIIAIKNDSTLTKYNSVERVKTKELVKYRRGSVDKKIVKYRESDRRNDDTRRKPDVIRDTVDAWAKKNSKSILSDLRDSIFGGGVKMNFKPLVFGGTYPIDVPTDLDVCKTRKGYVSDVDTSSSSEFESKNFARHRKRN